MARSKKTTIDNVTDDPTVEEPTVEEQVENPSALSQAEEEEAALREHIFFLTRGRVLVPAQPMAELVGDPPPGPEAEISCSYDEWIREQRYHSRPLLAAFRIIATKNGWYYAAPSFWEHEFTSWMHQPI